MAGFPAWTGYNFTRTLRHSKAEHWASNKAQVLPGSVVCVTGASRGIGAGIAQTFAEAGVTALIVTARSEEALQQTKKICTAISPVPEFRITCIAADVGSPEGPAHIAEVIAANYGRLDVLINNAGIMCTSATAFGKLESTGDEQFDEIIAVNYTGRLRLIKLLLPIMRPSTTKTIINISSLSSHLTLGTPMAFNISELANNRLIEALAEMYLDDGYLFHAVHPGMVMTTLPPGFPPWMVDFCQDSTDLCGAFLVWLTAERRGWLSGRYLSSNWDVSELEGSREEIIEQDKLKMRMTV